MFHVNKGDNLNRLFENAANNIGNDADTLKAIKDSLPLQLANTDRIVSIATELSAKVDAQMKQDDPQPAAPTAATTSPPKAR